MRSISQVLIITIIQILLLACAPAATPATLAPTSLPAATAVPAPVTIKFGQVGTINDAAIYIAVAKGFFKEQGIIFESVPFQSGALMIAPLSTNEIQAGGGAINAGLFNAYSRGINLTIVADEGNQSPGHGFGALVVRKDLADQIKGPKDLKGKTIALSQLDGTPEFSLNSYLQQGGLTVKDANIITMAFPDMVPALQNQALDAAYASEPTLSRILSTGLATVLIRSDAMSPNTQGVVIFFSEKFAKEQREAGVRFMIAYLKGARLYNDAFNKKDPTARAEVIDILAKATKLDPALFGTMVTPGLDPNGKVNVNSLENVQKYFLAKGSQQTAVDLNKVVDMSFVAAAVQELGEYK
jgi:NitT/TauT family transport system substrate-binding protein